MHSNILCKYENKKKLKESYKIRNISFLCVEYLKLLSLYPNIK